MRLFPENSGDVLVALLLLTSGMLSFVGCHTPRTRGVPAPRVVHDPEFVPVDQRPRYQTVSHESVALAVMPESLDLAGEHSVDEYVQSALFQNPQVQAKRKRVEASAQRVPQAASLNDPTVAITAYPFNPYTQQTAGGRMLTDIMVSQEVPWFGKLDAKAQSAEAEVNMARAELAAAELEVIESVKRAYYELYYVQRAIEITTRSRELAVDLSKIADVKYRTGQTSQQDLLRAELEVSNIDSELIRLRQELQSAQARLARLVHVSPNTPVRTVSLVPQEELPRDLERLYAQAVAARPELHVLLAAVQRDRFATDLARLEFRPDVTFNFGWGAMTTNGAMSPVADGKDNVTLGLMANIPIYRARLNAGVHEAEANVVASAREYDNLRDMTQEEVKSLFAQAASQEELLQLFEREILPKAEQTLQVSMTDYESNKIDFLQLIDNWRALLRYQLMHENLESQLRQKLASLERLVGGSLPPTYEFIDDGVGAPPVEALPIPFLPDAL